MTCARAGSCANDSHLPFRLGAQRTQPLSATTLAPPTGSAAEHAFDGLAGQLVDRHLLFRFSAVAHFNPSGLPIHRVRGRVHHRATPGTRAVHAVILADRRAEDATLSVAQTLPLLGKKLLPHRFPPRRHSHLRRNGREEIFRKHKEKDSSVAAFLNTRVIQSNRCFPRHMELPSFIALPYSGLA